jgi:hypothetical protein
MAVLTPGQLTELRQFIAAGVATQSWTKLQVNAALQALENWYESSGRAAAGSAIETAAPGVFTNAQKKLLGKYWLLQKAGRE